LVDGDAVLSTRDRGKLDEWMSAYDAIQQEYQILTVEV
jgi:hypothetical protein